MDIISINKTMTKQSKQTKSKIVVSVVALKRAVLKFFLHFLHEVGLIFSLSVKFLILLGCRSK